MSSLAPVLASHVAALVAWALFVQWEVKRNAALIKANGSADDLKAGFHSRRTYIRLWWWLGCCVGGSLAAGWPDFILSFGALGFLLGGYFARSFNPLLNVAMGLDYKARFYCSPSPTAARWPDRYVWEHGRKAIPDLTQDQANEILHHYLNWVLVVSLVGYAALMAIPIINLRSS